MSLRAGIATKDITPRKSLFLAGYPHARRNATGIHDPLRGSALFLAEAHTSLLIISVDALFITAESTNICRAAISRACGVPASNILISATHTHSAPVTASMLAWRDDPVVPPPEADYLRQFHDGIIQAAVEAGQTARPAELAITTATIAGVGSNRLAVDGPFDAEAGLILVRAGGNPLAVSVFYGMHPTVLHEDSTLVSADFPHFTRRQIEAAFPGSIAVYHTGACGNLSPRYHVHAQTFAEAERLGGKLGDQIVSALRQLGDRDFQTDLALAAGQASVELLPNQFATVPEAEAALGRAREQFIRLQREGADHGPLRTAECSVFGYEEALTLAQAQATGEAARWQEAYRHAEVQVFRMGGTYIVGFPGEQFVEYALDLKRRAPARTFIASLANGELQGYIVTPEAARQPGYEAAFALFAPASGERLVATALRLMKELPP